MLKQIRKLLLSSTSKDTFVTLVGNGFVTVIGLVFTILVARSLGPEDFGVFSALISIAIMLTSVGDMGISAALVNFLPKTPQSRSVLVSMSIWIQALIGTALALLVVAIGIWGKKLIPNASLNQYVITAGVCVVYIFSAFGVNLARAERKFALATIIQTLDSLVKLVLTVVFFYLFSLTIDSTLLSAFLGSLAASLIVLAIEQKQLSPQFEREHFTNIYRFIKWVALIRIFSVMVSRIDILLLNTLSSAYVAGLFAASSRITLLFALLVSSLGGVVAPRFSAFTEKKAVKSYLKKLTLLLGGVSLVMLLTTIFADQIVNLIFTDKFADAAGLLRWMTIAMIPFLLSTLTVNPLMYTYNQPRYVAIVTIIQVTILVVLDILLIPKFQAYGPIVAIGVSNSLVLLLTSWKLWAFLKQ